MPGVGTKIVTDPHDFQSSFRGAKIDLIVSHRGDFKARLTWVELPNLHLLEIQESLARIAFISFAPKRVFVSFPTHFDQPPVWNGVELHLGDIVFHSLGECGHQRVNGPSRWATISLTPERLAKYGTLLADIELVAPPVGRILRPPASAATRLRRLHGKACRLAETKPDIVAHQEVARSLEQDLIHALVECLAAEAVHDNTVARPRHASIMARFEDFLARHIERPIHMREFCAATAASERTLRVVCAEFLGMGPSRYARLRRLNMVRAALRQADPATACVAELATRYGFSQLGRFAVEYRTVFGESPSVTLRNSLG